MHEMEGSEPNEFIPWQWFCYFSFAKSQAYIAFTELSLLFFPACLPALCQASAGSGSRKLSLQAVLESRLASC